METFIEFLPIVIYALIGTALFYIKKITFNNQMALLVIAAIAHAILSFSNGSGLFFVGQLVISLLVFFLMVFFFAGKTSGETILTLTSLLLLSPIPHGILPMVIVFVLVLVATIIAFRDKAEMLKLILFEATTSAGISGGKPDYSHLPDRATLAQTEKRTSVLPYMAAVMTVASLYYLVQPLFLDS